MCLRVPLTSTDACFFLREHNQTDTLKIQTEFVDVYLLSPPDGEDRGIELKDFTIMKPKNNKMHRLVRYYPRCEISYTAAPPPPPPEEKLVTSPRGTTTVLTTTSHRHNGGFSNPSRNAEVFRLKRKLLNEYFASVNAEFDGGGGGSMYESTHLTARHSHNGGYYGNPSNLNLSYNQRPTKRPGSPSSVSSDSHIPLPPLPKYTRIEVGDEDSIETTSERKPPMSLKARVQYIDSLWPGIAPIDDDEDIMDYYGLEVEIISEEDHERELKAAASTTTEGQQQQQTTSPEKAAEAKSPEKAASGNLASTGVTSPQKDDEDHEDVPEMTVETRSAALQKIKDAEKKVIPVASKQDDWVQCDKCQKWRRLPSKYRRALIHFLDAHVCRICLLPNMRRSCKCVGTSCNVVLQDESMG